MRETEQIESKDIRTICVKVVCDIKDCGAVAPHPNDAYHPWGTGRYNVNDVTISHERGNAFPEGRFTEKAEVDICPKCFETKIVPMLVALGVKVEYKDGDL